MAVQSLRETRVMLLPDQMPDGCNFYGLLRTALAPEVVAQRFAAAGWTVSHSEGQERLKIAWGHLSLTNGNPMVLQGRLDLPDDHVGKVLGLLGNPDFNGVYQWINAEGHLWRELPFDESMLNPDDSRLPANIKESLRANLAQVPLPIKPRKPWWRFW